jgi:hypothetical protein
VAAIFWFQSLNFLALSIGIVITSALLASALLSLLLSWSTSSSASSKLSMRWHYVEAHATVLLYDGFAVLDRECEWSDVDSKLGATAATGS